MKKSKILVPALAILCLSTAASVTGTVAWFTANQSVSFAAGSFFGINPSAGLEVKLAAGINTSLKDTKTVVIEENKKFRDASVDLNNAGPTVYKAILDSTGTPTGYATVSSKDNYKYNDTVIYAATWQAEFALKGDASFNYDFYFDGANSTFSDDKAFGNCFRLGMYISATTYLVWAPRHVSTFDATHVDSVSSTTATGEGYSNKAVDQNIPGTSDDRATAIAKENFLTTAKGQDTITVHFVAWYEGCDPDCKNTTAINTVAATMSLTFGLVSVNDGYKSNSSSSK